VALLKNWNCPLHIDRPFTLALGVVQPLAGNLETVVFFAPMEMFTALENKKNIIKISSYGSHQLGGVFDFVVSMEYDFFVTLIIFHFANV
jgi:hypothetical protein